MREIIALVLAWSLPVTRYDIRSEVPRGRKASHTELHNVTSNHTQGWFPDITHGYKHSRVQTLSHSLPHLRPGRVGQEWWQIKGVVEGCDEHITFRVRDVSMV